MMLRLASLLFLCANTAQAAELFCEIGYASEDGSRKRASKSEKFKLESEIKDANQTQYITLEDENLVAGIIYFANTPDISIINDKQMTNSWVVTVDISSKRDGDLMDLRTAVMKVGSEAIKVFDSRRDGSEGVYASCTIQ
jgi:hypothetical protein